MKKIITLIIAVALIATMGVVSVYAADITNVKEEYTEGEIIELTYEGADRANNEWICIYVDGTFPGAATDGGTPSVQYAYIGGNGKITFNDPSNTVSDREAVLAANDATFTDEGYIYYNDSESVKTLPVGDYYAIILGGADWYEEVCDPYYFSVVAAENGGDEDENAGDEATEEPVVTDAPTEEPTEEPATDAPATDAPTAAPTAAPTEEPADEKGCGSVVASGAAVIMLAVAGAFLAKKRED